MVPSCGTIAQYNTTQSMITRDNVGVCTGSLLKAPFLSGVIFRQCAWAASRADGDTLYSPSMHHDLTTARSQVGLE